MAETSFRPCRGRRRAGRLCRGDPGGAAWHERRAGRARASRRHLPELGLHPDQGAAARLGNPPPAAPSRRVRLFGARHLLRPEKTRGPLARRRQAIVERRRLPAEEEQGHGVRRRGEARRQRKARGGEGRQGRSPTSPPSISCWRPARAPARCPGSNPTASWCGPTRRRWSRKPSRNRCWSSARARSASNSPASTATWAPR